MSVALTKLQEILDDLESMEYATGEQFDTAVRRLKVIARKQFEGQYNYHSEIEEFERSANNSFLFNKSTNELCAVVKTMIDDIELDQSNEIVKLSNKNQDLLPKSRDGQTKRVDDTKVFVVHGHNEAMKEATARTLEKLGLSAIILHEKANSGNTLIEKFVKHSDVGFAVVLLSSDDYGYSKNNSVKNAKLRTRQNVVFEFGYFIGYLGRNRVVAILESVENFEKPSDLDGVVYIPYTSSNKWQLDLARELKEAGYQVDYNRLM
jgi:predicted nucleotide-binding protein